MKTDILKIMNNAIDTKSPVFTSHYICTDDYSATLHNVDYLITAPLNVLKKDLKRHARYDKKGFENTGERDSETETALWETHAKPFSDESRIIYRGNLAKGLKRVAHAMSNEETRYYLNGAYIHIDKSDVRFVATDGHRLCVSQGERSVINFPDDSYSFIMPKRIVAMIAAFKDDYEWIVRTSKAGRYCISVPAIGFDIYCRSIDGTYPSYARIKDNFKTVTETAYTTKPLLDAAKQAVKYLPKGEGLYLTHDSLTCLMEDTAPLDIRLDGQMIQGDTPQTIRVNSRYLKDAITAIDTHKLTMDMTSEDTGMIMLKDGSGAYEIIMGMRR